MQTILQATDSSSYRARADRSIQAGRVVTVDKTANELVLDVGMVDANGDAVYMHGVPFSPQTPPQQQDIVALLRTNSSPYSMVVGSGAQVGGANSGQIVATAGVNSLKKTGETTGQQGDLELEAVSGITLTRTGKKFSFANTTTPSEIGGTQTTGVAAVHTGQHQVFVYDAAVSGSQAVTLPNLVLASGPGQLLHYTFFNGSAFTVTVTANTTTFTNTLGIAGLSAVLVLPGQCLDIVGLQDTGSDGIWRDTSQNVYLRFKTIQSGTTYTLALTNFGSLIEFTSASAVTVTIPPNSSVAFPLGTLIELEQIGAGGITVAPGSGVTLEAGAGLRTAAQYSMLRLRKSGTDTWVVTRMGSAPRGVLMTLCSAFTPSGTGADTAEVVVPYSAIDGTSAVAWNVRRIDFRVNVAGGAPAVTVEKSTASTAFSAATVGTVTLGSGAYEGSNTTSLGTVSSGDKLRFSVGTLATATGWTVEVLLGE